MERRMRKAVKSRLGLSLARMASALFLPLGSPSTPKSKARVVARNTSLFIGPRSPGHAQRRCFPLQKDLIPLHPSFNHASTTMPQSRGERHRKVFLPHFPRILGPSTAAGQLTDLESALEAWIDVCLLTSRCGAGTLREKAGRCMQDAQSPRITTGSSRAVAGVYVGGVQRRAGRLEEYSYAAVQYWSMMDGGETTFFQV